MSGGKIILAALLGGIVLFLWGTISHMVLGVGETGIKQLPNEEAVLASLMANLTEAGLYFFPGLENNPQLNKEEQKAVVEKWSEKYKAGPHGILVYHPEGEEPISPKKLFTEFLTDVFTALLAAIFLARSLGSIRGLGGRIFFIVLLGFFANLVVDIPHWNWYGFPTEYTVSTILDNLAGFALAGVVMGFIIKPPPH